MHFGLELEVLSILRWDVFGRCLRDWVCSRGTVIRIGEAFFDRTA